MSILRARAFRLLSSLSLAALPLAGCQPAVTPPAATVAKAPGATLVVTLDRTPKAPALLHATHPYDWYDVEDVRIQLTQVGATGEVEVDSLDLDGEQAEAPITFTGLAPHTTYRVRLRAYRLPGFDDADLISVAGPGSEQEIRIEDDETPTFARLRVRLKDVQPVVATEFAQLPGLYASYFAGAAVVPSGSVYVSNSSDNKVYRIHPDSVSSTVFGGFSSSYVDGPASSARFAGPRGLVADAAGNVYVADSENGVIRKITPADEVETYAGTTVVNPDGTSTDTIGFDYPVDVALDAAGNLYVADQNLARIFKITPAGVVSTVAGSVPGGPGGQEAYRLQVYFGGALDGPGLEAVFQDIVGLESDAAGNLYVAETGESPLVRHVRASDGFVTTLMGEGWDYPSAEGVADRSVSLSGLSSIALADNGDLFLGTYEGLQRRDRRGLTRPVQARWHDNGEEAYYGDLSAIAPVRRGPIFMLEANTGRVLRLH